MTPSITACPPTLRSGIGNLQLATKPLGSYSQRTGGASNRIRTARSNLSPKSQLLLFLKLGVLTTKPLHAPGRIHQFLLTGEEGMAVGADFHTNRLPGRTSGETDPAGTGYRHLMVLRMNLRFQFSLPRLSNLKPHIGFQSTGNRGPIYHIFRFWQGDYWGRRWRMVDRFAGPALCPLNPQIQRGLWPNLKIRPPQGISLLGFQHHRPVADTVGEALDPKALRKERAELSLIEVVLDNQILLAGVKPPFDEIVAVRVSTD